MRLDELDWNAHDPADEPDLPDLLEETGLEDLFDDMSLRELMATLKHHGIDIQHEINIPLEYETIIENAIKRKWIDEYGDVRLSVEDFVNDGQLPGELTILDLDDGGRLANLEIYEDGVVAPNLSKLTLDHIIHFLSAHRRGTLHLGHVDTQHSKQHLLLISNWNGINKRIPKTAGVEELYLTCNKSITGMLSVALIPNLRHLEMYSSVDSNVERVSDILLDAMPFGASPSKVFKFKKMMSKQHPDLVKYL